MTTSKPSNPKDSCGIKKVPHSTIPSGVIGELGLALLEGARKYGRHNQRVIGVLTSVYYDAAKRHLDAFWEGQDTDPDSGCGLSHITKAIASLTVLRDAQMVGTCVDDRPPPLPEGWQDRLNQMAVALIEHYPDPKEAFTAVGGSSNDKR